LFPLWTDETHGRRDSAFALFALPGAEATSLEMFALSAIFRGAPVSLVWVACQGSRRPLRLAAIPIFADPSDDDARLRG
jgi:hypothetical protein